MDSLLHNLKLNKSFINRYTTKKMDKSSFFIQDKAIFGSYPTNIDIQYFIENGVNHFINLTFPDENLKPYHQTLEPNITYSNFILE